MNSEEWFLTDPHPDNVGIYWDKFISEATGLYQIMYTGTAPRITAFTDTIEMPDNFDDSLRILAVSFAYKDIKKYDKSSPLLWEVNWILNAVADRVSVPFPSKELRLWSNYSWK